MIINLIVLVVFVSSLFAVWHKISQRIPKLAMVSDEALTTYLREESGKLHFFIVEIKSFYKDKKYKEWLRDVSAKLLYRFHILLLRLDNKITTVLKNLRAMETKAEENKSEVMVETKPLLPRIQEVRIRKRKNKSDVSSLPT